MTEAGFSYVFKKSGRGVVKQMVETGAMNDNEIVVRRGVERGTTCSSRLPADGRGSRRDDPGPDADDRAESPAATRRGA